MPKLIPDQWIQPISSNGLPYPGAKLLVQDAGTTTNRVTYSDSALTIQNDNPLIADASGRFGPMFLAASATSVKLTLTDASDVPIDAPLDNVPVSEEGENDIIPAESAAGLTETDIDKDYLAGNLFRYKAIGDGATDDILAWNNAELVASAGGPPIFVPKTSAGFAIGSAATSVNDIHFEEGAFLLYTGSANETALTLGTVTGNTLNKTHRNIAVQRSTLSDWTSEASIGVRLINLIDCYTEIHRAERFTVGVQAEGNDYGHAYNKTFLGELSDNKISIQLVTADTVLTAGFCNENIFYGGRLTNFSATNTTLDRWGIKLTSTRVTKSYPNSNLFHKPSIEVWNGGTGTAYPILIEYGLWNRFEEVRDESNDTPFMECQNDSEWNIATVTTNVSSAVSNTGNYDSNFVYPVRAHPFQRQNSAWQSPVLPRVANEYDGAGAVYVPGCSQRNSSNGSQALANTSLTVDDDYLDIPTTRGVGVMVDVANIKRFVFRRDVETGRGGRILVMPYDATVIHLTTDGSYVRATGANSMSHTTNFGGGYQTNGDSDGDLFFSVTSDVHFIWVGYIGGTATARVRSFAIESVDGGALSVFQGYLDANSDPFPNDLANYATAAPATATAGPNYPAGKRLTLFNAAAGGSPGWICTTQGLGGTAVFKAEANVAV